MSSFLILGLIPGTHIQITFLLWLVGAGALVTWLLMYLAHRTHVVRNALITSWLLVAVRRVPPTTAGLVH